MIHRLFQVPDGSRVRIESQRIRWVDEGVEELVAENVVWFGTATQYYWCYLGKERRLVVDHSLEIYRDEGIWQIDCDCYLVG